MRRIYLLLIAASTATAVGAQQLPNASFEDVFQVPTTDTAYPTFDSLDSPWTSANAIWRDIPGVPPTFYQDTSYAYHGSHAAMMRTQLIGPAVATGNLAIGYYQYDSGNPFNSIVQGTDFPYSPSSFDGYMDYLSMSGDSCRVEVTMSKWNGTSRDTLGYGILLVDTTTGGYVPFSVPINYTMAGTPDTTHIIFLSSYSGLQYMGVDGSTLIVDSVYFTYGVGLEEITFDDMASIYQYEGGVELRLSNGARDTEVTVLDMSGRKVAHGMTESGVIRFDSLPSGPHVIKVGKGLQAKARNLLVK